MNQDLTAERDEQFSSLLAAWDDALAKGDTPQAGGDTPPAKSPVCRVRHVRLRCNDRAVHRAGFSPRPAGPRNATAERRRDGVWRPRHTPGAAHTAPSRLAAGTAIGP